MTDEIPLGGGRITAGVVRVGDTVRRPSSEASPAIAKLLAHFEALGVTWAPRYLGQDEHGRDILTYLHGEVPPRWITWRDDQVEAAGRMLRAFHDASRDLDTAPICHNDFGPHNTVFVDDTPVAMIDFDMIAPGAVIDDLACSAWAWCISLKKSRGPVEAQARQVRKLVDAYGLDPTARHGLIDAITKRHDRNAVFWQGRPRAREFITWSRQEKAYLLANRQVFEDFLFR